MVGEGKRCGAKLALITGLVKGRCEWVEANVDGDWFTVSRLEKSTKLDFKL